MNPVFNDYRQLLVRYLRPFWSSVLLLSILLFGGIALQLINPQIIRYFLDTAQSGGAQRYLLLAGAAFIGISLLERTVTLGAQFVAENTGWKATNALRLRLTLHCLRLDMPFHKAHTPGELIERIDGDVTALSNFFSRFIIQIVGSGLLIAGILVLLFRENAWVGLGLTAYAAATLAVLLAIQKVAVRGWQEARQSVAEMNGYLEERISGAEEIRAAGAEDYALQRLMRLIQPVIVKMRRGYLIGSLTFGVTELLYVTGYAIGLAFGVLLYLRGQASIGAAYVIVYYVGMLSVPLQNIRKQMQDFQRASASIGRIQALFDLQPQVQDDTPSRLLQKGSRGSSIPDGSLSVEFSHVDFFYAERQGIGNEKGSDPEAGSSDNILKDVSFTLPAGNVLGVLGRTGSGKTTLTRLLFRLYDPAQGEIRLGGVDLHELSLAELRQRVAMVTQDVQLFQASVRDNLTFFNREIPDQRILEALYALQLEEWLEKLPNGLDTRLTTGGKGLSAGEAQLLAFARVFLKDPSLVILDEASSRLDPTTEARLERAIDSLLVGRTGILIAHRLKTVQRADKILILEGGRVVEWGSRKVLAAQPGSRFSGYLRMGLEEAAA